MANINDLISRLTKGGFWEEAEILKAWAASCDKCKWQGSTECRVCRRNPELPDKWEAIIND